MRPRQLIPLAVLLLIALHLPHAMASAETGSPANVFDPSRTPVRPVPSNRWTTGYLQPAHILHDSTGVSGEPGDAPFFHELAIVGNYLFTATGQGMMVFDLSNPLRPFAYPYADASKLAPFWAHSDKDFYVTSIAVPSGDHTVTITGAEDFGLLIWDTRSKRDVRVHYQDSGVFVRNVYAASLNGHDVAFVLDGKDLRVYHLDTAQAYRNCLEAYGCPGVYRGNLETGVSSLVSYVSGAGNYLVHRSLTTVSIFDVSNLPAVTSPPHPASLPMKSALPPIQAPLKLRSDLPGVTYVGELAMWTYRDKYYLAVAAGNASRQGETRIYDVSCIASSKPCALPAPLAVYSTPDPSNPVPPLTLDVSFYKDGRPFLYVGTSVISSGQPPVCAPQREYLFDMSHPASATEITPKVHPKGYWGWYYEPCDGYNGTAPRHAMLRGSVLYRVANSFLDSHLLTAPPPTVEIFADGFESGSTSAWSGTSLGRL